MDNLLATTPLFALDKAHVKPAVARDEFKNAADPARKAAVEFESVLLSQILDEMFAGVEDGGPFGGGMGEKMFRGRGMVLAHCSPCIFSISRATGSAKPTPPALATCLPMESTSSER